MSAVVQVSKVQLRACVQGLRLCVGWGLLALALGSCRFARTQTVVQVRADARVTNDADDIRIEVRDRTGVLVLAQSANPRSSEFPGFPLDIPISARNGDDARTFVIRVVATSQRRQGTQVISDTLAENRIRAGFRRGQVLYLGLWLLSGCRCDLERERCEPDTDDDLVPECVPQFVDVQAPDAGVADASLADTNVVDADIRDANNSDSNSFDATLSCRVDQRICSGVCVSRNSPIACGATCERCATVSGGNAVCNQDACSIECGSSTPDRCPDACVNFDSDNANCGACGVRCSGGQLCIARRCQDPPQCLVEQDSACAGATYCNLTTRMCAAGCDGRSGQCATGQMCDRENHRCVCATGTVTCGNACVTCPSGPTIVATGCVSNSCAVTACQPGYQVAPLATSCIDVDECATNNGGCGAGPCTNTEGSFACACESPLRQCSGACVRCPTDSNSTTTTCTAGPSCVIAGCANGFQPNAQGTACTPSSSGPFVLQMSNSVLTRPAGTSSAEGIASRMVLSVDGLTLVVASKFHDNNGAALFYTRATTADRFVDPEYVITRPAGTTSDWFAEGIAMSDDQLALAISDLRLDFSGRIYLYTRSSRSVRFSSVPVQTISSALLTDDFFGTTFGEGMSFSADLRTLAVVDSRYREPSSNGAVHIFTRASTTAAFAAPTQTIRLASTSLASGNAILAADQVSLYVGWSDVRRFRRATTTAAFDTTPAQTVSGVYAFGLALSRDQLTLVVGAANNGTGQNGQVRIFTRATESENFPSTPVQTIEAPSGARDFGNSVAIRHDGNEIFVGDPNYTQGFGEGRGAIFVYGR